MRLSETLSIGVVPPSVQMPSIRALERSVERVLKRWPDVHPEPLDNDREWLVQELKRRFEDSDWQGAKVSFVNQAAHALFDKKRCARPALSTLRKFYTTEIACSDRQVFLGNAVQVYVGSFQSKALHTKSLAGELKGAKNRLRGRAAKLVRNFSHLLVPDRAPDEIAGRMITMSSPFHGLKELGLSKPHAPGLMDEVHLAYLKLLAPQMDTLEGAQKLLVWLKPEGQPARQSGAAQAIDALLRPWLNDTPDTELRQYLIEGLSELYGDLRLHPGGVWASVSQASKDLLYRWLTGESMRFLFDVLTEVEETHMWTERREFWMDQYEKGNISAAWVAFGKEGERLARRRLDRDGPMPFGHQTASGSDKNKSLLVMKIGQRIFVEGTSNFKVHIYAKNDPDAPKLYQTAYSCEFLRHGKFERTPIGLVKRYQPESRQQHHSNWQRKLTYNYPELL